MANTSRELSFNEYSSTNFTIWIPKSLTGTRVFVYESALLYITEETIEQNWTNLKGAINSTSILQKNYVQLQT